MLGNAFINCEVNLFLTWSSTCVITNSTGAKTFAITDTKLNVPVVTLGFKRVINWNKYLSKPELLAKNPDLNHLNQAFKESIDFLF